VQRLANAPVDVAALALPSYGSLDLDRLKLLGEELDDFAESGRPARRSIVLDLGRKKPLGSGFLSVIERLREAASSSGQALIVAGDDGGLLAAAGWRRRIPYFADLADALNAAVACRPLVNSAN